MTNRCDICVEEECGGKRGCNCDKCDKREVCPKFLRPTIRITTKCTQSCSHCCFECSPKKNDMMSVETARKVGQFLAAQNIQTANVMGGEFFMNPQWFEILNIMLGKLPYARIVSNGDWAQDKSVCQKLKEFFDQNKHVKLSLSKDSYHTNKHVLTAEKFCIRNKILHNVQDGELGEGVVPVGRAEFNSYGMLAMFSTYCSNPEHRYAFLIDEEGDIFKCPFGIWKYGNVSEFQKGGFAPEFKRVHRHFFKTFISNCRSCHRAWQSRDDEL